MQQPGGQTWNGDRHHWPPLATVLFLLYEYGFILVCNLSLFEITESEPRVWLLKTWTHSQTSLQVMQRDSDTADSGKPRVVVYCVKISMSKSVAVLPQVWKIHC